MKTTKPTKTKSKNLNWAELKSFSYGRIMWAKNGSLLAEPSDNIA